MTTLTLELVFLRPAPLAERVRVVFGSALAGKLLPAHLPRDADVESQELLENETIDPQLFATRLSRDPITHEVLRRAATEKKLELWCAFVAGLPRGQGVSVEPFLRFAFDLGEPSERLVPLVVATLEAGVFSLRFAAAGAPLLLPPSRDHGGPIDQAWARSVRLAREDLGQGLALLLEQEKFELKLSAEGPTRAELEALASSWPALPVKVKG